MKNTEISSSSSSISLSAVMFVLRILPVQEWLLCVLFSFELHCTASLNGFRGNMSSIFDELLDTDVLAEVDDGADITGDSMFQLLSDS